MRENRGGDSGRDEHFCSAAPPETTVQIEDCFLLKDIERRRGTPQAGEGGSIGSSLRPTLKTVPP
jgi:hypothetical protein